jgi:Domain of unknown function (DUF4170)
LAAQQKQLLHLVFGGELKDPRGVEFEDTSKLDLVGIYPSFAEAERAWRAKAQATIDNAHVRYFVVHLHRLLDPGEDQGAEAEVEAHPS